MFGLSLVVLLATPTKWTMHFGALVPVGTALIVVAVHLFGRCCPPARRRPPAASPRPPSRGPRPPPSSCSWWAPSPGPGWNQVGLPVRPGRALEQRPAPGARPELLLDVPHPGRPRGRRRGRDRDLGAVRGPRGRAAPAGAVPAVGRPRGGRAGPAHRRAAAGQLRRGDPRAARQLLAGRRRGGHAGWAAVRAGGGAAGGDRPRRRACSRPRPGSPATRCSTGSSPCPTAARPPGRTWRWPAPGCPGGPPPATPARTARVRPAW